jgi:hypothetical protein
MFHETVGLYSKGIHRFVTLHFHHFILWPLYVNELTQFLFFCHCLFSFVLYLIFHVIDGNKSILGFVWVCKLVGKKKNATIFYFIFFHRRSKLHSHLGLFLCFGVKIRTFFLVATSLSIPLWPPCPFQKFALIWIIMDELKKILSRLGLFNLVALPKQLNKCFSCTLKMWGLSI